jgi:Leucine-rich repeat (LRR) protein
VSLEETARVLGRVHQPLHSLSLSSLGPELTLLPGWLFSNLSVAELSVSRTGIKDVDESTFSGMERSLTRLAIQHSRLTYVPRGINKVASLRSLDLEGNNITELYPYSFYGASITGLSLAANRLSSLTENAFLGLEGNLRSLNLRGNNIRNFPSSAVKNLQNLETLNLGNRNKFILYI